MASGWLKGLLGVWETGPLPAEPAEVRVDARCQCGAQDCIALNPIRRAYIVPQQRRAVLEDVGARARCTRCGAIYCVSDSVYVMPEDVAQERTEGAQGGARRRIEEERPVPRRPPR